VNRRRPFAETLLELLESFQPADDAAVGLGVRAVGLDLPFDQRLAGTPEEPELLADLPRWRWRTYFDDEPSRLTLSIGRGGHT